MGLNNLELTLSGPSVSQIWHEQALRILSDQQKVGVVVCVPFFQFRHTDETLLHSGKTDLRFKEQGLAFFEETENLEIFSGCPRLFRNQCLNETGGPDADFKYFGEVEFLLRCRKKGWRVLFLLDRDPAEPKLPLEVKRFAKQNGQEFDLERFRYLASGHPAALAGAIRKHPGFFSPVDEAAARTNAARLIKRCLDANSLTEIREYLPEVSTALREVFGEDRFLLILSEVEALQGYSRKLSIGIYDHALHTPGGGQKYACTMAAALQEEYDVTFIANKPFSTKKLEEWYGLDLSCCGARIVRIPFYEKPGRDLIDQGAIPRFGPNPFDAVSKESRQYDIFMNVNMLTKVKPLSVASIFLCHFPDSKRTRFFSVDDYTYIIANSLYTIGWLKKRWGMRPSAHLYPPVDMKGVSVPKKPVILSVARFDQTGSKKQLELINAFDQLCREAPSQMTGWKLVLAGGTFGRNPYLRVVKRRASTVGRVEILENLPASKIRELYASASIFWHACGLDTNIPEKIEHFGMATAEAMQNGCVPVVINKGGQREIVEQGISGFLFDNVKSLCNSTHKLVEQPDLRSRLSDAARIRSERFNVDRFQRETLEFFRRIQKDHFSKKKENAGCKRF